MFACELKEGGRGGEGDEALTDAAKPPYLPPFYPTSFTDTYYNIKPSG